jgi:hypothetical protein
LVWQRHAPTKRSSDSGVGTGQRPDLVQCSMSWYSANADVGDQSVEVVESVFDR